MCIWMCRFLLFHHAKTEMLSEHIWMKLCMEVVYTLVQHKLYFISEKIWFLHDSWSNRGAQLVFSQIKILAEKAFVFPTTVRPKAKSIQINRKYFSKYSSMVPADLCTWFMNKSLKCTNRQQKRDLNAPKKSA